MIDKDIILDKAGKIDRHLRRIKEKRNIGIKEFLADLDRQESILFNIQMAIQNCIDIAAHILSDENLGIAGSTNEMFYMLQENGFLDPDITEKMILTVGFRNLVVHEYGNVDLKQVLQIANEDIGDLEDFIRAIFNKCDIT